MTKIEIIFYETMIKYIPIIADALVKIANKKSRTGQKEN